MNDYDLTEATLKKALNDIAYDLSRANCNTKFDPSSKKQILKNRIQRRLDLIELFINKKFSEEEKYECRNDKKSL